MNFKVEAVIWEFSKLASGGLQRLVRPQPVGFRIALIIASAHETERCREQKQRW